MVRNLILKLGVSSSRAFEMATAVPAAIVGAESRGTLALGSEACLLILNEDYSMAGLIQRERIRFDYPNYQNL